MSKKFIIDADIDAEYCLVNDSVRNDQFYCGCNINSLKYQFFLGERKFTVFHFKTNCLFHYMHILGDEAILFGAQNFYTDIFNLFHFADITGSIHISIIRTRK